MKFEEALKLAREGKKVRRVNWSNPTLFFTVPATNTSACVLGTEGILSDDWEVVPEPKKPKLMAPALMGMGVSVGVSVSLFSSEKEAREELGNSFLSWPAVANAEGFYSLEGE